MKEVSNFLSTMVDFAIFTRISQPLPFVEILTTSSNVEHAINGRRSTNDFTTMPRTGIAVHGQTRSAIWFSPEKQHNFFAAMLLNLIWWATKCLFSMF
jgi:hypothetical protein